MKKLPLLLLIFFLALPVKGQRLVSVLSQKTIEASSQFDSLMAEFGAGFDAAKYQPLFKTAGALCRRVRFVSLEYKTQDPLGREVVASGLMAYPEKGSFKGMIEVSPICKEKHLCGTVRGFTVECLPSMMGYVILVPDTIGYGSTASEPVALLMSENVAQVSADLRLAAQEYLLAQDKPRKLPRNPIIFGYSLGAAGALATAMYYSEHPELGVKPQTLYLASGAYSPAVSVRSTLEAGESGYMVYPSIAVSLNHWLDLDLHNNLLFQGRVLTDMDRITCGKYNLTEMAQEYGQDIHTYLHPDFFSEGGNGDIKRLMTGLESLTVPSRPLTLPRGLKIYLRHSAEDTYVPVACTDILYRQLKREGYYNITYYRDKTGNHYDEAAKSFFDLFVMIF